MSSTFQAVIRGPSLTPLGKRPALIPAHHVDRETGNTCRTAGNRIYPSFGIVRLLSSAFIATPPHPMPVAYGKPPTLMLLLSQILFDQVGFRCGASQSPKCKSISGPET
jgi:hypothetical protein